MPPPRLIFRRHERTHPLVWLLAIICALLAVAVIITGIVVFAVYLIYQPRLPYLEVAYEHLNKLEYDQSGLLSTEMAITILAENGNARAHASFSDVGLLLQFQGTDIAELQAAPFDVVKKSSVALSYMVPSSSVPLDEAQRDSMEAALQQDRIPFMLSGKARTRWRVGPLGSVKYWTHLSCDLLFSYTNGSSLLPPDQGCTSKTH